MKRLSFILLALLAFGPMAWAQQTYQRVTSGLTDWSGNYVMAVPQNSTTAFAFQNLEEVHNDTIGDFNVGRITSVPLENDIITSSGSAAVLTIEKSTDPVYYGYYTIRIKGGDYLYIDTNKLLGTTSEITQNTYWNIIYTSNGIKFTKYKWEPIINLYLITFLDSANQPNGFFSLDDGTIYQDYNGYHFIYSLPYLYKETSDGNNTCENFESYNYISEVTNSDQGVTPSQYLPTDWKGYGSRFYPFVANFTFVNTQEDNFIHFMAIEGNNCFLALPYEHVTEVDLEYAYLTTAQGTLEVGYMTDISGESWYNNTFTNVMTLSNQNNNWQSETVDFSNISANTYYVVFKFSENSDTGARAAIDNVCVTTSLPPYDKTIPYTYGFEDEGDYSSWSTENCEICFEETNRYGRYYDPSQAHTGSYSFAFTSFCYETDPQYLISPKLDGVVDGVHVEFYYCNLSTSPETFEVGYSTTDNNVNSFTWVDSRTNTTTNYQQFKANYMGDVKYVAVKYSSVYSHYLLLDDFTIQEAPSCLEPTNVMASNETITSATISWTAGGSEIGWDLYFTTNSSDVPTASTAPSFSGLSTNTYDLTDLAPATTYYVYVRAACSETEKSDWSTPCSFNTECQSLTLPYSYGFEVEILSVCWNILISDHVYMEAGLSYKAPYEGFGHLALFRGTPDLEDYQIVVLPEAAPSYALSNYEVSFFARLHDGGDSGFTTSGRTLAVGIMTDPMDPSTFVQVGEPISPTDTYQRYTVNLSSYTGDGQYIAIKHFSTENNAGYTLIDDVEVNALSCYVPDGLNASATAASASLGWHGDGDQSNYNVRYRTITVGEEETTTEDFSNYTAHDYNITSGGDRPSDWAYNTNNDTYVSPHVSSNYALSSNYTISGMDGQGNFLYMNKTTIAVMPQIENLTSFSFKFAFEGMTSEHGVFYMGYVTDATNITGTFNILSNHSYQATTTLTTVTLTSEDINILNNTYGARIAFRFVCSKSYGFGIDDIVYTTYPITYGEWENANNQTSPLAISGLTPATNYQWQVQGIEEGCSDGEGHTGVTRWSKMATFTTLEGCVRPIEAYSSNQDGWNLIASPIGTVSIEDVINLCSNTYDLYRFNQAADKEWENYKATENGQLLHTDFTSLVSGKGYLYANSQDVTLEFVGLPYNEAGSVTLEYSTDNSNENMHGWNLIGNPFATEATLDKPFFRMNEGGTALTAQVEAGNTVAAMEGVFVQATQEGQTALFTQVNNRGGEKSEVPMINVNLIRNRGEVLSNAIVRFDHGETLGTFSLHEDDSKIYITQDGKDYAVARSNGEGEIPVSFKPKENGTYTISVNAEGLEMNYLHLIDNMTGADIDLLATSSYTFTSKTTDYESRFKLVFSANGASTGSGTFAYMSDGNIIINGEGVLQVVDVMGRVVVCRDAMHCVSTTRMAPGVYVLRLIDGNDVKTQKIVIK